MTHTDARAGAAFDVDVEAVRAHYGEGIGAYQDAIRELEAARPELPAAAFGAGFAAEARLVSDALEEMHRTSRRFLVARSEGWEQVIAFADAAAEADAAAAETLGGVMGA